MKRFVEVSFVVRAPLDVTWNYLADFEEWPSWAKHVRSVKELSPGPLSMNTRCTVRFTNGLKSTLAMREFNPMRNWRWGGSFLWLNTESDHVFEAVGDVQTKLTWTWACQGLGAAIMGRTLAWIVRKHWHTASSLLAAKFNSTSR